jgi:cell fate regulator YaaT (PSP1 superfamily)
VHDWLANLPFHDPESACKVIEVSFNNGSRKEFYRNTTLQVFIKHELVTIEGVSGFDVGEVSCTGELVRLQMKKKGVDEGSPEIKKVLRRTSDQDIQKWKENKSREPQALVRARAVARQLKLDMKLIEVEIQADGRKATFFYTADDRVDFRELIKIYASEFKVKVEMKQIGARQESAKVGGIGSCGRELCCSTWLSDFKSVTTTIARYQNLSINQTKLSGQCGRLKCCLNYELDTYLDALQNFPDNCDILETQKGNAVLVKKDIFKNLMWYVLPDSNRQYPVAIESVKKIKAQNLKGIRVEELEVAEVLIGGVKKEVEPQFVDVVGQISLRTLERNSQKKRQKERDQKDRGRDNRDNSGNRGNQGGSQSSGQGGNRSQGGGQSSGQGGNRQGGQGNQGRTRNQGGNRSQGGNRGQAGSQNSAGSSGDQGNKGSNPPDQPRRDFKPTKKKE